MSKFMWKTRYSNTESEPSVIAHGIIQPKCWHRLPFRHLTKRRTEPFPKDMSDFSFQENWRSAFPQQNLYTYQTALREIGGINYHIILLS